MAMFTNTIKTLRSILNDISKLLAFITVVSQLVTIGYFSYQIAIDNGYFPVNVTLVLVSAVYLALYLFSRARKNNKRLGNARRKARRITKAIKLTLKAFTLSVTLYGIYLAEDADGISIILATLSIIFWIIQTLTEVIRYYGEIKLEELKESLAADVAAVRGPAETVINAVHNIREAVKDPIGHAGEIVNAVKLGAKGIGKLTSLFRKKKAISRGAIIVDADERIENNDPMPRDESDNAYAAVAQKSDK